MYRYWDLLLLFAFCFFSCNSPEKKHEYQKKNSFQPALVVNASQPIITSLASSPPPIVMTFPKKGTTNYTIPTYDGKQNITFSPPTVHPILEGEADGVASMQNFNTEQGLALSSISCGYTDKKGNLWFGTFGGGVSCYNGKSFTNYTTMQGLAGNLVKSIIQDRAGNMWFGTNGNGVSKYDGKAFTNYTKQQGLAGNVVKCITEDKGGNLWFGTDGGLSKYSLDANNKQANNQFTNFTTGQGLINNYIQTIITDKSGDLWMGTTNGVSRYDGNFFTNYTVTDGLINNNIYNVCEDDENNLWFVSFSGLSKYNPIVKSFTHYTLTNELISSGVYTIHKDNAGNIWVGTTSGISKYNPVTNSFVNWIITQEPATNTIYSINEDKMGNLWFGTSNGGINRYTGKTISSFVNEKGLNKIWAITEDKKGNLWFGTNAAITKYDSKSFYNLLIRYVTASIRSIIKDKSGNIWFGGAFGLVKYNEKSLMIYTTKQGLGDKSILSIIEDKKGNLWIGTYGDGVFKFDGKSFLHYSTAQGLANNTVKCITEDKNGNIWFGTNGNGVSKFNGTSFTNYTMAQGLANNNVLSSIEDKHGNLWFGTFGSGVSKYDGYSFTNYTTANGLANDVVYAIAEDTLNQIIWFGTNSGLSGLKQNTLAFPETSAKFENYNNENGYPIKDINTGALFIDSKGILWAGTSDKLIRFDYNAIKRSTAAPVVFIGALKIQGEKIGWYNLQSKEETKQDSLAIVNEEAINWGHLLTDEQRDVMRKKYGNIQFDSISPFCHLPINLVLPYRHNNVVFDFAAIETGRPQLVRYQYCLEGYDNDWSAVTNQTSATFGNIYEGTYTFKLKAQSPDGVWSKPVTYTFKVLPPLYRTWWAYIAYLTTGLSLIWLFFRWRIASLKKEKELLEQTVKERTTEVVEQKELIEEKQKEIVDSINYAKRIQYTLLANDDVLQQKLKNYFVLFQPKDIVSGDFYWATEVISNPRFQILSLETQPETLKLKPEISRFYLAVCDSTGHGVPGAFMSLLNISFLNEAITEKNIIQPNEILNHVRQRLIENISQDGAQDGMDGILLCFENGKITYAAANNAPVIVRNNLVIDLPTDKMPIGKGEKDASFTLHSIDTQKGDMLYFYTDGYADQFGGPKGKKFKYKQLTELLISIHQQSMEEQKQLLASTIERWKGNLEQVDDILIIGLQIME